MNSLKSLCSFTQGLPVAGDDLEKKIDPSLRREGGVELPVGVVRRLDSVEDPELSLHG
jgi:hypothetical protein